MANPRRSRTTTPSRSFSSPEINLQALSSPWLELPTLSGLRDRLWVLDECWTLMGPSDGTSRLPVHLPRGSDEPQACYLKRLEGARPTGFYSDALRTSRGCCRGWPGRSCPTP